MQITHEVGKIYNETAKAIAEGHDTIVHRGGTSSGKTYEIMLFIIMEVCMVHRDKVVTVVSESFPHLYKGAYRIFQGIMKKEGWWMREAMNESKMIYTFIQTGTILEFISADRVSQSLGNRRFFLYVNEINHTKMAVIDEMARRSRYFISDFNPTAQFWLEELLNYYGDHKIIKSNVYDNKFADDVEKGRILRRAELDENFYRVHIECEYGTTEGLVFPNFTIIDEFPKECKIVMYGLDFGYTNDPTALVKVGIQGESIYLMELIYERQLTNDRIAEKIAQLGIRRPAEIFADSAEPKSIDEIHFGKWSHNIKPALKGKDSINNGIDLINQHRIYVTKDSTNIIKELRNYTWDQDKSGNALNKPIDDYNHALDAARYAVQTKLAKRGGKVIKVGFAN